MVRKLRLPVILLAAASVACGRDSTGPGNQGPAFQTFTVISAGQSHTCGVTTDSLTLCWGSNASGELGDGTQNGATTAVQVAGGHRFTAVGAGDSFTCGLTASGAAYCWGSGLYGQLGNGASGSGTMETAPVQVLGGLTFSSISVGSQAACGLDAGGDAHCWGRNGYGELSDSTTTDRSTPVAAKGGVAFASLDRGASHTCGVTLAGDPRCWGMNFRGQLGNPATTQSCTVGLVTSPCATGPLAVSGGLVAASVSAGGSHTCLVDTSGNVYCWGNNRRGQVGASTTQLCGTSGNQLDCAPTPVAVSGLPAVAQVSTGLGSEHTCALTTSGAAYCWGVNSSGELGNGGGANSGVPVAVGGGLSFTTISSGGGHTCGIATDESVHCWGRNGQGQLGDGTTMDRSAPVALSE